MLRVQVALRTCLEKFHFCFASTTDVVLDSLHMQEDEALTKCSLVILLYYKKEQVPCKSETTHSNIFIYVAQSRFVR